MYGAREMTKYSFNAYVHAFIGHKMGECVKDKERLLEIAQTVRRDGLGLADIGAKLAKIEGELEAYSFVNLKLKESEKKI